MGCDRSVGNPFIDTRGQGTVEYALVLFALLAIVLAFGTLWHALETGSFAEHAADTASHTVSSATPGTLVDVLLF